RTFGGDRGVVGGTMRIDERVHTIVGVMPPGFQIEGERENFYEPLAIDTSRGHGFLHVVARLQPGATLQQAGDDMRAIAERLAQTYPRQQRGLGTNVVAMTTALARSVRFGLLMMLGVVALVLLIACANVAGLMLARGAARQRELAVRAALGAGRARLARQLLTESTVSAPARGALGLLAANWTARTLAAILSEQFHVPRIVSAGTDVAVLTFTLVLSVVTGIVFGSFPALASAAPDLNEALRDATRGVSGVRAPRLRRGLVVLETALALVLLAGAGTLLKTLFTLQATHPGFETASVLKADLLLPLPQYNEFADRARFYEAAQARVRGLPGVRSAAFVSDLPLGGGIDTLRLHVVGRPDPAPGKMYSSGFNLVTTGYFATLSIPIKSGREFSDADRTGTLPVIVVNETAARTFWPGQSPLGRQIEMPGPNKSSRTLTVVGVTGDVRHVGLGLPPRPEMFLTALQAPLLWPWTTVVVKATGNPVSLTETVKAAIRSVDPTIPVHRINTLDEVVAQSI